jgi:hypothetical protein
MSFEATQQRQGCGELEGRGVGLVGVRGSIGGEPVGAVEQSGKGGQIP